MSDGYKTKLIDPKIKRCLKICFLHEFVIFVIHLISRLVVLGKEILYEKKAFIVHLLLQHALNLVYLGLMVFASACLGMFLDFHFKNMISGKIFVKILALWLICFCRCCILDANWRKADS